MRIVLVGIALALAIVGQAWAECSFVLWAQERADPDKWQFVATYPSLKYGAGLAVCNEIRSKSEREQPRWRWHCVPDSVDPRPKGK